MRMAAFTFALEEAGFLVAAIAFAFLGMSVGFGLGIEYRFEATVITNAASGRAPPSGSSGGARTTLVRWIDAT
jgi:hypothetical protein